MSYKSEITELLSEKCDFCGHALLAHVQSGTRMGGCASHLFQTLCSICDLVGVARNSPEADEMLDEHERRVKLCGPDMMQLIDKLHGA